jgi:hypothetical protein
MFGTHDRVRRYTDRAEECIETAATSRTPGTGQIYLLIAEHCLLLAASEVRKASSERISNSNHE